VKADFSRDTFHRQHHFARVLMQQGRVLLDADWNEQIAILLHQTRALAADLIGPHGGAGDGYRIDCLDDLKCDFVIGRGAYYVEGIRCENLPPLHCPPLKAPEPLTYTTQPDFPIHEDDGAALKTSGSYLVYLDVWERHLNHLQADHIRELALGGPDTATRAQVVCQVKAVAEDKETPDDATCSDILEAQIAGPQRLPRCLRARARVETPPDDPCIIAPESQYRGAENQLYRVEIHNPGTATDPKVRASFKWSRENGSVVFGLRSLQGSIATLASLGPNDHRGLKEGHWVEVVDDYSELRAAPRRLLQVAAVDRVGYQVTLTAPQGITLPVFDEASTTHPLLRRWDQPSDVIPVQEGKWIDLEDGVQIWFEPSGDYKTGDHWLIPARTAIADVLWPDEAGPDGTAVPKAMPPNGIAHHYAPLARISLDGTGVVSCDTDCRCTFEPLCAAAPNAEGGPGDVEPLAPVISERNSVEFVGGAREALQANVATINGAIATGARVRVDLRSIALEGEDAASALADRRAKSVADFYVAAGIPTASISRQVSIERFGPPRVETDLVRPAAPDRAPRIPVAEIKGVGETLAARLADAGIEDAAALAALDVDRLIEILSPPGGRALPRSRAEAILKEARARVARR
jgi:predicted flap endonuclease-1-like 5' DNA nuclease